MQKIEILRRIVQTGIVAVIRAGDPEIASAVAESCARGGMDCIEITFTIPGTHRALEQLAGRFPGGMIELGAGTVLDSETARIAILPGARFIVSLLSTSEPRGSAHITRFRICQGRKTVTGIVHALEYGADIVKIFPAETIGTAFVRQ